MTDGFNLNGEVWVRLTPEGRKHLVDSYDHMRHLGFDPRKMADRKKVGRVWYRFQLWDLMRTFAPMISLNHSKPVPFVNNEIHYTKPEGAKK